ncbi:dTDP-4-dehydrorhamnose reductase [uncultured Vibrio sp.]|uniref:dTDP-4-dehydrorhamnose reductase n=1 Tax=uncultured Vibrio sp. TaxID=114054 RepID=UPI0029C880B4|nr:dTDP-4-dehydrorhamnose reductase [uncultured Vibrio sp.]
MRLLIIGGNGQVGYCLTKRLSEFDNATVLSPDKEELDITNQDAVKSIVQAFKPTIIINAAAHTAVDRAEEEVELSYAINRDGPKFLAEAAQEVDAAILHISTDYVFEGNKDGEYCENDITNPQGVYGASKLAGEREVARVCEKHIILRTAWVFGETGNNFVKTMLRLGLNKDSLSIVGDQLGGPTYAGDIADALIQIAEQIANGESVDYGVYHYSGLPHVSWFEFADVIFDAAIDKGLLDKKPNLTSITTAQYPTPAKRPSNSRMSTKKVNDTFSIEASDWKVAVTKILPYLD